MKYIIYTDGASRGNPGPAAASFVVFNENNDVVCQDAITLGVTTNNVAEYQAVKLALACIKKKVFSGSPFFVEVRSDSRLIVEQLSGRFKIKDQKLREHYNQIKPLEVEVGQVVYTQIPRSQNTQADLLANLALDQQR